MAAATLHMVEHGHRGAFHATGPEFVDRLSLARRICGHFGLSTRYGVRLRRRDAALDALARDGITAAVHYPMAVHGQPLARANALVPEILSLPMYLELTDVDAQTVAEHLNAWAREAATLT